MVLPDGAVAGAQHDGAAHVHEDASRGVLQIADPQRQGLPIRSADPRRTSVTSHTCEFGFGPFTSGPVRHTAAAARMAAICSSVSARGSGFGFFKGEVPSTGSRGIASCRSAKPNSSFSRVRECFAREYDTAASRRRNHSTRPVVISPSV